MQEGAEDGWTDGSRKREREGMERKRQGGKSVRQRENHKEREIDRYS